MRVTRRAAKALVVGVAAASACMVLASCSVFGHNDEPGCAGIRWKTKTLGDDRAKEIDSVPVERTVKQLMALRSVAPRLFGGRRDDELSIYRVRCEIVRYMIEGDGDVHLVIRDPGDSTRSMIAEIPDARCPDAISGGHAAQFAAAKASLLSVLGADAPRDTMHTPHPAPRVVITGVGFYDIPHFQGGAATNDLELHPVIALEPDVR